MAKKRSSIRWAIRAFLILLLIGAGVAWWVQRNSDEALLRRAAHSLAAGDYESAKILYRKVALRDLGNFEAVAALGKIFSDQGATVLAGRYLTQALELAPDRVELKERLALAYKAISQHEQARGEAEEILQLDPENGKALLLLSSISANPDQQIAMNQILDSWGDRDQLEYMLSRANLAVRRGDLVAAGNAVDDALQQHSDEALAHQARGELYLFGGDAAEAETAFQCAFELAPSQSPELLRYPRFLLDTDQNEKAIGVVQLLTRKSPNYYPVWVLSARLDNALGNHDVALDKLRKKVLAHNHASFSARILQAEILLALGRASEAMVALETLIDMYSSKPLLQLRLAQASIATGDVQAAEISLNRALKASPRYVEAFIFKGQLGLSDQNLATVAEEMEGLLSSQIPLTTKQLRSVESVLEKAYQGLQRLDDMVALYETQLAREPGNIEAILAVGVTRVRQKDYANARQRFEEAKALAPDHAPIEYLLVDLDMKESNPTGALQRVEDQLAKTPESADFQFVLGKVLCALKRFGEAEAALNQAITLNELHLPSYELLTTLFSRTGRSEQALAQLELYLAKNPNHLPTLIKVAEFSLSLGQFDKAVAVYEKILEQKPNFTSALNNLAYIYSEHRKDYTRALELASRAYRDSPDDPGTLDTLGWITYRLGDFPRALQLIQRASINLSEVPEIQYHLGMAHYMVGQTQKARLSLRNAMSSETPFPGQERAQRLLSNLDSLSGGGDQSLPELMEFDTENPDDPFILERLAAAYASEGDHEKAVETYQRAISITPFIGSAHRGLAELYAGPQVNQLDKALVSAQEARKLSPQDPDTVKTLAVITFRSGKLAWAHGLLKKVSNALPEDRQVIYYLALGDLGIGQFTAAAERLQRLVSPADGEKAEAAAMSLAVLQSYLDGVVDAAASARVSALLKIDPENLIGLLANAALEEANGHGPAAIAQSRAIVEHYTECPVALRDLALLHFWGFEARQGGPNGIIDDGDSNGTGGEEDSDLAAVRNLVSRATLVGVQQDPVSVNSYSRLQTTPALAWLQGELQRIEGNELGATQRFNEVIEMRDAQYTRALCFRGMAHLRLGQATEGNKLLDQAVTAGISGALGRKVEKTRGETAKH